MAKEDSKTFLRNNRANIIASIIIGFIGSLAYVGFVYGFFHCGGGLSGIFERFFIGLVQAFNSFISFGHLYVDEAGHHGTNLRLYVLPVFILFSFIAFWVLKKKLKR